MNVRIILAISLFLICQSSSATGRFDDERMYRYTNKQGIVVTTYSIPPKYTKYGYEILNGYGQILQVVPREPTAEEKAQAKAESEQRARLAQWDNRLLSRYSFVKDIEAAKERKLAKIEAQMGILRSNTESIGLDIERKQAEAAKQERAKKTTDPELLEEIQALFKDRRNSEDKIKTIQQQYQEESQRFDRDIERFKVILEKQAADKP